MQRAKGDRHEFTSEREAPRSRALRSACSSPEQQKTPTTRERSAGDSLKGVSEGSKKNGLVSTGSLPTTRAVMDLPGGHQRLKVKAPRCRARDIRRPAAVACTPKRRKLRAF